MALRRLSQTARGKAPKVGRGTDGERCWSPGPSSDFFAVWGNAGRPTTPNSAWKATRPSSDDIQLADDRALKTTLRTMLVGQGGSGIVTPMEEQTQLPRLLALLQGDWVSRNDGELRGYMQDDCFVWAEDGSSTPFKMLSGGSIRMMLDGVAHSGVVSEDGAVLRWGDGDIWTRIDSTSHRLRCYCGVPEPHQAISHRGWTSGGVPRTPRSNGLDWMGSEGGRW